MLGAAFKPEGDDVRDSPALSVTPAQLQLRSSCNRYGSEARLQMQRDDSLNFTEDATEIAMKGADALLLLTE